MGLTELYALIPILVVASISVVLMLLVTFIRHHRLASLLTYSGFLLACVLTIQHMGTVAVQITPLLIVDDYSRFFTVVILLASLISTMLAYDYLERCEDIKEEYYILISLAALGAVVLVSSNHFAAFFIGMELLSVSLFAMVGYMVHGETKRVLTLEASIKYMILSGVSSSFLLFGVALVYADFGSLSFTALYELIGQRDATTYSIIGTAMIVIGLAFKLSWVPFHMWTPDVYEGAPAPVTAFLATVSKVSAFAIFVRFFIESGLYRLDGLMQALALLAILSMLVGNGLALRQKNIKRLLAYSSIAHLGYLMVALIAIGVVNPTDKTLAIEATAFYLVAYMVMSLIAFGVVTVLSVPEKSLEAEQLHNYRGLFWSRPALATSLGLALLSLAGIPLTIGFVGKFYIFAAGVAEQLWVLITVLIIGSAMGLYYYLGIILEMCKTPKSSGVIELSHTTTLEGKLVLMFLSTILLILGIFPNFLIDVIGASVRIF